MFGGALTQASNKADYIDCVEIVDDETGAPYDLTTLDDIVFAIRHPSVSLAVNYGGAGGGNTYGLNASLKTGSIALVQPGVFQFHFTAAEMNGLPPQYYDLGIILIADDQIIYQLIVAKLSVIEGFAQAGVVAT